MNTNYKLYLMQDDKIILEEPLPDNYQFQVGGEWAAPWADTATNLVGNNVFFGAVKEGTGVTARNVVTSAQRWQGNAPLSFSFPLQLRANSSTNEVVNPLKVALFSVLPSQLGGTGQLVQPSSSNLIHVDTSKFDLFSLGTWQDAISFGGTMTVQIGNFMRVKDVFLKGISVDTPTKFHKSGAPIEINLTLEIETIFTPTLQAAESWFLV